MLRTLLCLLAAWLGCVSAVMGEEAPALTFSVERFQVEGSNPLDADTTTQALAPFTGPHEGIDGLLAAVDALNAALRAGGHTFYHAVLPPQELDGGTVLITVSTFDLGAIEVEGNQHFSAENILRSLPGLKPGAMPNTRELARELVVANDHPSKDLKVNFRESEATPNALDAVVKVSDEKPWNVFVGANDVGTPDTGRSRLTVGGQYTNLTGHDDILTGSFGTSFENANDVRQYAGFYQLPLYGAEGWFNAFYVKSDVDVGNVQNIFDVTGAGEFFGFSFRRSLVGVGRYHHAVSAGVQDRLFDTGIASAASGTPLPSISTKVRSRPFSLRYDGGYNWESTSLDFYADFNHNLDFGVHNDDSHYTKVRHGAEASWKLLRFGGLVTQRLPYGFAGVGRITGQYTSASLIPGEQLGFGGARSVRGFEERTISGDRGVIFNAELWGPSIQRLYGLRLLGFIDVGYKELDEVTSRQRASDTLSSIGLGARWQWRKQLSLAVDYGLPLAHADGEAAHRGTSKWHLDLQFRY